MHSLLRADLFPKFMIDMFLLKKEVLKLYEIQWSKTPKYTYAFL